MKLAREVGHSGGTYPAVYNAANEVCVEGFLSGRMAFSDILDTVERVVRDHGAPAELTLEGVLAADRWARNKAAELSATSARGIDKEG